MTLLSDRDIRAEGTLGEGPSPRGALSGLEIDVADIPPKVAKLRFYNFW